MVNETIYRKDVLIISILIQVIILALFKVSGISQLVDVSLPNLSHACFLCHKIHPIP